MIHHGAVFDNIYVIVISRIGAIKPPFFSGIGMFETLAGNEIDPNQPADLADCCH